MSSSEQKEEVKITEQQLPTEQELQTEIRELYVSEKDKKISDTLYVARKEGFTQRDKAKLDKILLKNGFPKSLSSLP